MKKEGFFAQTTETVYFCTLFNSYYYETPLVKLPALAQCKASLALGSMRNPTPKESVIKSIVLNQS